MFANDDGFPVCERRGVLQVKDLGTVAKFKRGEYDLA
jgi:hypothetical protein